MGKFKLDFEPVQICNYILRQHIWCEEISWEIYYPNMSNNLLRVSVWEHIMWPRLSYKQSTSLFLPNIYTHPLLQRSSGLFKRSWIRDLPFARSAMAFEEIPRFMGNTNKLITASLQEMSKRNQIKLRPPENSPSSLGAVWVLTGAHRCSIIVWSRRKGNGIKGKSRQVKKVRTVL